MTLGRTESFVSRNAFLVVLTGFFCAFGILAGDRVTANNGLGWDGVTYALYIKKLNEITSAKTAPITVDSTTAPAAPTVDSTPLTPGAASAPDRKHGLNPYYFHRLAPIVAVHGVLRTLGLEHTDRNIVLVFLWMNAICLLVAAFLWGRILDLLGCTGFTKLVAYGAVFINFCNLKMPFYDPVLMDTASFSLAVVLIYFYLSRKPVLLWMAALLGDFIHPWLFYIGALLFLVPNAARDSETARPPATGMRGWIGWGLIALVTVLPWLAQAKTFAVYFAEPEFRVLRILSTVLGMALVVAYLRVTLWPFLDVGRWPAIARAVLANGKTRLAVVVGCFVAIELAIKLLAVGKPAVTPYELLLSNAWRSMRNPLVFAVAHFWYFGPLFAWFVLRWKDVVRAIHELGDGLVLMAAIVAVGLIDSESRRVIVLLPFAGIYLAKAMSFHRYRPSFYALLIGTSLLCSRAWLPIRIDRPWSDPGFSPFAFPWQWFFMNLGPWMLEQVYLVAAGLMLVLTIVLWRAEKRSVVR